MNSNDRLVSILSISGQATIVNNSPVLWAAVFFRMVANAIFARNKDHSRRASAACVDTVVARSAGYMEPPIGAHKLCSCLFNHLDTVRVELGCG